MVSGRWVVTVRRERCEELDELRRRVSMDTSRDEELVVYKIFDTLTDTFFPALEQIDDAIDELEDMIVLQPTDEQLQRVFTLKRRLVVLRRIVTPQRDLAARTIEEIEDLPGPHRRLARLLPRRLRPPDPRLGPDRLLPRPADRDDGRLPLDRLEPPQRRDEAADARRDRVPADHGADRLLRPELRLARAPRRHASGPFVVFGVGGAVFSCVALYVWFRRQRFLD